MASPISAFSGLTPSEAPLHQKAGQATIEIKGLDIYDPIKDEVKSRDVHDIAYWMVDTDYDGANFIVRQAFFCGGDKDEFDGWKKASSRSATSAPRRRRRRPSKSRSTKTPSPASTVTKATPFQ